MKALLKARLHRYIIEHNPELLIRLQEGYTVRNFISDRVAMHLDDLEQMIGDGVAQEQALGLVLEDMTADLRPSRYLYLKELLKEEFSRSYEQFNGMGVLTYELINMMDGCTELFESFGFCEDNRDDRFLRHAVIAEVAAYLNSN